MKRGIFLSIILGLCLITCIPQVMAQKQSRMEKLLRYLNDNDADKWQKNREKLDDETHPITGCHKLFRMLRESFPRKFFHDL